VAHAYTPGLRVSELVRVRRERRLPLKGEVKVKAGEPVEPASVVACTELPGNVQTLNLAANCRSIRHGCPTRSPGRSALGCTAGM